MVTPSPALQFVHLNEGWNAEPNASDVTITVAGNTVRVEFDADAFQYPEYTEGERLGLEFSDAMRYRFVATNDEGWWMGKCRFGRAAPRWGEFYEVAGDVGGLAEPGDWNALGGGSQATRHFLFYFRDETFECIAAEWRLIHRAHAAS